VSDGLSRLGDTVLLRLADNVIESFNVSTLVLCRRKEICPITLRTISKR